MKVSIFIKSRKADFPWLEIARDSIELFCKGFHEIVLCLNEGEHFFWPGARIVHVRESFTGYNFQQAIKTYADTFCTGDYILFSDSDVCFTREVTPDEFFQDGKPIWIVRPYGEARSDQQIWRKPSSDFIGQDFPFEGMYRHPHVCPVTVLQRMRGFCQFKHGVSLDEYIRGKCDPSNELALVFSEFNAIAAFAYNHCKDQLTWVDASKDTPRTGCTFQSHTHGAEKDKYFREFRDKFREILGEDGTRAERETPTSCAIPAVSTPVLTEASAIEFLASQVKNNFHKASIIKRLKSAWKGKGQPPRVKVTTKMAMTPVNPDIGIAVMHRKLKDVEMDRSTGKLSNKGLLLCIHSYPGANETMVRHWPNFQKFGATRIAGIGTTDGKCTWPDGLDAVVDIGKNSYLAFKGKDGHLCQRLLDTIKWCLTQPEDHFAIVEYDTLILRKFPHFSGIHAHLTGGKVNGSKTNQYHHNPWLADRASAEALVAAMEAVLPDSQEYPNNSPDLFFGLAVERAQIEVKCCFKLFTRNSLDANGDLELACEAAREGVHAIHGCKMDFEYESIMSALNNQGLLMSHVA